MPLPQLRARAGSHRNWQTRLALVLLVLAVSTCWLSVTTAQDSESSSEAKRVQSPSPDDAYLKLVAPVFNKYCMSCHEGDAAEGGLSLATHGELMTGGDSGPVIEVGDGENSYLIQLVRGDEQPVMPPDEMEGPTEKEISQIVAWIDAGAKAPASESSMSPVLDVPRLEPAKQTEAITAIARSPRQDLLAIGSFQQVRLIDAKSLEEIKRFENLTGKVNSIRFSHDGKTLIAAGGITGLVGVATAWQIESGKELFRIEAHRDSLYAADLSPDGKTLATAGYDKSVRLWNSETGAMRHSLVGHNQPIYDLDFSPDGATLVSASGDETLKVWDVASGERLDTLSQPLGEQFVARFTPDGNWIVGGGADNRIRVWRFVSKGEAKINPLVVARFAHEGAINAIDFSVDGKWMITASEDRMLKAWDTSTWREAQVFARQPDIVSSVALISETGKLFVSRLDGSLDSLEFEPKPLLAQVNELTLDTPATVATQAELHAFEESEPNGAANTAQEIALPAAVTGFIDRATQAQGADTDCFRFAAKGGETWILEVIAGRNNSPLDSYIEILDENGEPVPRVLLQAVRDSYFTFRGKDSNTSDDFRVHNWEEMELNEFLYANGEVVKLWLYPRGPDSGFKVYPGKGERHTFFDTTAMAHALQEPCFIVRPYPPQTELVPNGLPVFPVYFSNDDDSLRRYGSDSWLQFTAPVDGNYVVRLTDARGFGGDEFRYELRVRPARPNFRVQPSGLNVNIPAGGGREFLLSTERIDGFQGPIEVELHDLPEGFHSSSPITIEAGQYESIGVIWADGNAASPSDELPEVKVTAKAKINGEWVTQDVGTLGKLSVMEGAPPRIQIERISAAEAKRATSADPLMQEAAATDSTTNEEPESQTVVTESVAVDQEGLLDLEIKPGETIVARVKVERNGHEGIVDFGKEDSGRNLPHGVYVDNIGLNGLMIIEGQTERTFFITAADWVPAQERLFHLKANLQGGQCSIPVRLKVVAPHK